ncbi:MAG: tetratricopeptide repeat protein [Desulfopila sp.]|nr:tetratricopeptide repeat protein [Desulfopila sp.]
MNSTQISVESPDSEFSGTASCKDCHQDAYRKWHGSDHDRAMAVANEDTVLADFNDVLFTDPYTLKQSRFFRQDGNYKVETEGPDGKPGIFTITHTFGFYPLQQYLIPFQGGRLQCLSIAWDVDKKTWYRLPPYEVEGPEDWLHWTREGQTWNAMCAECHSTQLKKGFDLATESYTTSWFEINVGCEACHGPASKHVEWAKQPALARTKLPDFGLTVPTSNISNKEQIVTCAPCHSRRYQLGDNNHRKGDLLDIMVPSLLTEGLYHADGQILEEVYVYGSYTQSKMYMKGVKCSDCHDVHSLKLHKEKNDLCLQCHRASEYDTKAHHFHKKFADGKPSEGYLCVKCHMPGQYYMGIDYRPDHSLRIPRPDLSMKLGTPNGCSTQDCHGNKPLEWVTDNFTKWYGQNRKSHYGEVLAAGRVGKPEAYEQLKNIIDDELLPPIVRATALSLLRNYPAPETTLSLQNALLSNESLLRHTALRLLDQPDEDTILTLIAPKLYDPIEAVRLEAALKLASVPEEKLREHDLKAFKENLKLYRQSMEYNGDFAAQRYNLGNLERALGNNQKAMDYYRQSIAIDDQFFPAKVNLAMEYNLTGNNKQAEQLLREVLSAVPNNYEVNYSLGLLLSEMENYEEAALYLGRAADGMPMYSRARYNHGLALLKLKRWQEGAESLEKAVMTEPQAEQYFVTLVNLYLKFRMNDKARSLAERVLIQYPEHSSAKELLQVMNR